MASSSFDLLAAARLITDDAMRQPSRLFTSTPRRAGKSIISNLFIPGYSSAEEGAYPGGPEAYREELHRRNGTKPRQPSVTTDFGGWEKWEGKTQLDMEVDHMEQPTAVTPEDQALADLVGQYADAFSETPQTFALTAPGKHTTLTGKEYKIKPFIGSEDFEPVRAYIGKKKGTIIVFKPKYPCDFEFLEVPEKQCKTAFGSAFPMYMHEVLKDVMDAKDELTAQAKKLIEVERNAAAAESYSEFGSW